MRWVESKTGELAVALQYTVLSAVESERDQSDRLGESCKSEGENGGIGRGYHYRRRDEKGNYSTALLTVEQ